MVLEFKYSGIDGQKKFLEKDKDYNIKLFYQYVYNTFCQCGSSCVQIPTLSNPHILRTVDCNRIRYENEDLQFLTDINHIIEMLIGHGFLIRKKEQKVLHIILEKRRTLLLNWDNIKSYKTLCDRNSMYCTQYKEIFWMLRKVVIDGIIKYILKKYNEYRELIILSVGSNNLSSDYDITIYGNSYLSALFITKFNKKFYHIFKNDSAYIFDTNLYGKSYISFEPTKGDMILYDKFECNPDVMKMTFYYIKKSSIYTDSQIMWSLVKFLYNIRTSLGRNMYYDIYNYMNEKLGIQHLPIAYDVLEYLRNSDLDYIKLLANENRLEEYIIDSSDLSELDKKLIKYTDFVSLVNFFGDETYYSRGAFLDIVVNNQMCKHKERLLLDKYDYICSIIENIGFFFIHNDNGKYLERVVHSMTELNTLTKFDGKLLKNFNKLKKYNIKRDTLICELKDLKISQCKKYEYFQVLLKIAFHLLNDHIKTIGGDVFIPFQNYINKQFDEIEESPFNTIGRSPTLSNINKQRLRRLSLAPSIGEAETNIESEQPSIQVQLPSREFLAVSPPTPSPPYPSSSSNLSRESPLKKLASKHSLSNISKPKSTGNLLVDDKPLPLFSPRFPISGSFTPKIRSFGNILYEEPSNL